MARPKKTKAAPKSKRSVKRKYRAKERRLDALWEFGSMEDRIRMTFEKDNIDDPNKRERRRAAKKAGKDPLKKKKPGSVARKAAAKKGKAAKAKRTKAAPKSKTSQARTKRKTEAWRRKHAYEKSDQFLRALIPDETFDMRERKKDARWEAKRTNVDKLAKKKPGSVAKRVGEYPRQTGLEGFGTKIKKTKFKAAKAKPSAFKQAARALGRVGSKVAKSAGNPVVMAAELSWDMGSGMVGSHRKSGKKTALQKSRARTRKAAKAGKPRYGSWDAALNADRKRR